MSKKERQRLVSAKQKSGKAGKYRRSSKTNVKGARKKGATLRDWFQKEDWRQVNNPKNIIPMVIESGTRGERAFDIYSLLHVQLRFYLTQRVSLVKIFLS